jgi:hypothetical protein
MPSTPSRVEEFGHVLRILAVEQGAIDGDAESLGLGQLDRRHGLVEDSFLAHRFVVALAVAVQMNRESQIGRRLIFVDVPGEQNRIGAEIDEFAASDDAGDDLRHLLVNQRLSAGNGHDGRAAFVDRPQRVFDADPLLQDFLRVVDFPATGAGEIALEQRFQHEHERIALVAAQLAPRDVSRNFVHLQQWNGHALSYRGEGP